MEEIGRPRSVTSARFTLTTALKAIYELPFKVTLENKLRCFQYKIIHNILPTNSRLHKMKLKISPSCDHCSSPYETLSHLLYECSTVQTFWQKVITW